MSLCTAPSAPPTSFYASDVTSSSITLHWKSLDCIHHNGDITGYSVGYRICGSEITLYMRFSGGTTINSTISGLDSGTNYSVQVAAMTNAGIGVYSSPITSLTLCKSQIMI